MVLEVKKSFKKLGGGCNISDGSGSWLDGVDGVISENCVVIHTVIPLGKWYDCIPVLERLIRNEIQTKLYQKCAHLRIDNHTFGEPLNLLGTQVQSFPGISEFGGRDPAWIAMSEHEEQPIQKFITKLMPMSNIKLFVADDYFIGSDNQGEANGKPSELIEKIAQFEALEKARSSVDQRRELALETVKLAQELEEDGFNLPPSDLFSLGKASRLGHWINLAETYFGRAVDSYRRIDDKRGEAASLNNLGEVKMHSGLIDEAEHLFNQSMKLSEEIGSRDLAMASLANKGNILIRRDEPKESIGFLNQALLISRELNKPNSEAQILSHLGSAAFNIGDLRKARVYFRNSLAIQHRINDREGEGRTLAHLGNIARARGNLIQATRLFFESIDIAKEHGHREVESASHAMLGGIYEMQGKISEAMESYTIAKDMLSEIGSMAAVAPVMVSLGGTTLIFGSWMKPSECSM